MQTFIMSILAACVLFTLTIIILASYDVYECRATETVRVQTNG